MASKKVFFFKIQGYDAFTTWWRKGVQVSWIPPLSLTSQIFTESLRFNPKIQFYICQEYLTFHDFFPKCLHHMVAQTCSEVLKTITIDFKFADLFLLSSFDPKMRFYTSQRHFSFENLNSQMPSPLGGANVFRGPRDHHHRFQRLRFPPSTRGLAETWNISVLSRFQNLKK